MMYFNDASTFLSLENYDGNQAIKRTPRVHVKIILFKRSWRGHK